MSCSAVAATSAFGSSTATCGSAGVACTVAGACAPDGRRRHRLRLCLRLRRRRRGIECLPPVNHEEAEHDGEEKLSLHRGVGMKARNEFRSGTRDAIGQRHGIEPVRSQRIAAREPAHREPPAAQGAVLDDGLAGVFESRTARTGTSRRTTARPVSCRSSGARSARAGRDSRGLRDGESRASRGQNPGVDWGRRFQERPCLLRRAAQRSSADLKSSSRLA